MLDIAVWEGKGRGQAEMGQAHQILVQNLGGEEGLLGYC